jgi:hypothetical protein
MTRLSTSGPLGDRWVGSFQLAIPGVCGVPRISAIVRKGGSPLEIEAGGEEGKSPMVLVQKPSEFVLLSRPFSFKAFLRRGRLERWQG